MKRTILILLLALTPVVYAQNDSAAIRIVERYLGILNIDALPHDSMLVINTTVTYPGTTDTFTMRRMYMWPLMFRMDVFDQKGKRQNGLCTNGTTRFRSYDNKRKWWRDITQATFYNLFAPYDFRGPLYNWQSQGVDLKYEGRADFRGQQLEVVKVSGPLVFTRHYMFEETGLLAVTLVSDTIETEDSLNVTSHMEWICQHEYQQIGATVLPSLESFSRDKRLTILHSEAVLKPKDTLIFNQD